MKKLTLTKETIRDLSKPELDQVAGGNTFRGGHCEPSDMSGNCVCTSELSSNCNVC